MEDADVDREGLEGRVAELQERVRQGTARAAEVRAEFEVRLRSEVESKPNRDSKSKHNPASGGGFQA